MANSRTTAPSVDRNPLLVFPVMDQAYSKHFEDLPFENVVNAVRKVIKHKMSNEVYSATLNSLNDEIGLTKEMSKDDRSEKAKAFRESNADRWREVYLAEADKMWNIILEDGGISETDRPRVDPVERQYLTLLDRAIAEHFKGHKIDGKAIKVPSNDTDTIAFSETDIWTREDLRNWMAGNDGESEGTTKGAELRAKAEAMVELAKSKPVVAVVPVENVTGSAQIGLVKRPKAA